MIQFWNLKTHFGCNSNVPKTDNLDHHWVHHRYLLPTRKSLEGHKGNRQDSSVFVFSSLYCHVTSGNVLDFPLGLEDDSQSALSPKARPSSNPIWTSEPLFQLVRTSLSQLSYLPGSALPDIWLSACSSLESVIPRGSEEVCKSRGSLYWDLSGFGCVAKKN